MVLQKTMPETNRQEDRMLKGQKQAASIELAARAGA
jgi:hypothetical protein